MVIIIIIIIIKKIKFALKSMVWWFRQQTH